MGNNLHIHWYPGHIAKAERQLKDKLSLVDVVIEVRDARIPLSSSYTNIKKLLGVGLLFDTVDELGDHRFLIARADQNADAVWRCHGKAAGGQKQGNEDIYILIRRQGAEQKHEDRVYVLNQFNRH